MRVWFYGRKCVYRGYIPVNGNFSSLLMKNTKQHFEQIILYPPLTETMNHDEQKLKHISSAIRLIVYYDKFLRLSSHLFAIYKLLRQLHPVSFSRTLNHQCLQIIPVGRKKSFSLIFLKIYGFQKNYLP